MSVVVVAHPTPGFTGSVVIGGIGLTFLRGWASPVELPDSAQPSWEAEGYTLNPFPPPQGYIARSEADTDAERESFVPARLAEAALGAAFGRPPLNSLLAIGDSITQRSDVQFPASGYATYESSGFLTWAQQSLGQRLNATVAGADGETSAQVDARLGAALAAAPYAFVHLLVGTNDMISGVPIGTTKAAVLSSLDKIAATGAVAIVGTIPPYTGATSAQLHFITAFNRWIRSLPATRRGVMVADYHPALAGVSGDWRGVGTTAYTADGTHPSTGGAARMGRILTDLLASRVPPLSRLPASNADVAGSTAVPEQILANPLMAGTAGANGYGGGLTGVIADSWSTGTVDGSSPGTVVASKVARTDQLPGEWQQYVCSGGTPPRIRHQQGLAGVVGGDFVQMLVELQTDGDLAIPTNGTLRAQMVCYQAGTYANLITAIGPNLPSVDSGSAYPLENRPASVVLATPRVQLPASFGGVTAVVDFIGTGTIRIGRVAVLRG